MSRAVAALLLGLAVAGCQRALTLPGPGGIDGPPVLAALLVRHADAVSALRGTARAEARLGDQRGGVEQLVVAEAPDRLRLETVGLFGQPALIFASGPETSALFVAEEGRLYQGPGVARKLALLPSGVAVEDLVAILLGRVPRSALTGAAEGKISVVPRARRYRLDTAGSGGSGDGWRILVDADGLYPVAVSRIGGDGEARVTATFDDFRATKTGSFPYRIRIVEPARDLDVAIEYNEIDLNPSLPAGAFRLAAPRGVVPVEVE